VSLSEPTSVKCVAEDPSVLLQFDNESFWALNREHDTFRANFAALVTATVKQALFNEKAAVRPKLISFFHQGDQTRVISKAVLQRLAELGEKCFVFTDRELEVAGIDGEQILRWDNGMTPEQIRSKTANSLQSGRVIFIGDAALATDRALRALVACDQIFWLCHAR
jgi:hypothetical protein